MIIFCEKDEKKWYDKFHGLYNAPTLEVVHISRESQANDARKRDKGKT